MRLLWCLVIAVLVLAPAGCKIAPPGAVDLRKTEARADGLVGRVGAAATQVSGSAEQIAADAQEGARRTPEALWPSLGSIWQRIAANASVLISEGRGLEEVKRDVATLRDEVRAGREALEQANAAWESEKRARAADQKSFDEKLAKANSRWEAMFRTLSWVAALAVGIAVAVGVLMHDFRISIAGAAGGAAVILVCMVLGEVHRWLPWLVGGGAAVVALWIGVETWVRGSLWAALKTSPAQDLADMTGKAATPNG